MIQRFAIPGVVAMGALLSVAVSQPSRSAQRSTLYREGLRTEALGCYELIDSTRKNAVQRLVGAPAFMRLDSAVAIDRVKIPSYRRVAAFGQDEQFALGAARLGINPRWVADSLTDTIRVMFSNGFTGSEFILYLAAKGRADTLSGKAFTFGDAGPWRHDEGRAWAIRAKCPPPETEIRMLKRKTLRRDVVGCYALLDSNKTQWEGAAFEDVPDVVRLDSTLAVIDRKRDKTWRSVESIFYDEYFGYVRKTSHEPPSWAADSASDSVRLSFFDGLSGTVFSFDIPPRIMQDTLRGRATMLMDVNPFSYEMGRAWAVRRRCPKNPSPFTH